MTANGTAYFHCLPDRDLFVARPSGTAYAAPRGIAELNTQTRDAAPFVSADDRYMIFEHDDDLYESSR